MAAVDATDALSHPRPAHRCCQRRVPATLRSTPLPPRCLRHDRGCRDPATHSSVYCAPPPRTCSSVLRAPSRPPRRTAASAPRSHATAIPPPPAPPTRHSSPVAPPRPPAPPQRAGRHRHHTATAAPTAATPAPAVPPAPRCRRSGRRRAHRPTPPSRSARPSASRSRLRAVEENHRSPRAAINGHAIGGRGRRDSLNARLQDQVSRRSDPMVFSPPPPEHRARRSPGLASARDRTRARMPWLSRVAVQLRLRTTQSGPRARTSRPPALGGRPSPNADRARSRLLGPHRQVQTVPIPGPGDPRPARWYATERTTRSTSPGHRRTDRADGWWSLRDCVQLLVHPRCRRPSTLASVGATDRACRGCVSRAERAGDWWPGARSTGASEFKSRASGRPPRPPSPEPLMTERRHLPYVLVGPGGSRRGARSARSASTASVDEKAERLPTQSIPPTTRASPIDAIPACARGAGWSRACAGSSVPSHSTCRGLRTRWSCPRTGRPYTAGNVCRSAREERARSSSRRAVQSQVSA